MRPWRERLHEISFEAETPEGKAFDVALLVCIVASVATVLLESAGPIGARHGPTLRGLEWAFTLSTLEYALRLATWALRAATPRASSASSTSWRSSPPT